MCHAMVQPRHGIGFSVKGYAMNSEKKNPLFSLLNQLGQLILLSILWTICSLPVITIGASTAALYYTVVKVLRRHQDSLFAAFFREFRNNFLQSLNINMVFCATSASWPISPSRDYRRRRAARILAFTLWWGWPFWARCPSPSSTPRSPGFIIRAGRLCVF